MSDLQDGVHSCSGCHRFLSSCHFWKKASSSNGLQAKCKCCQRAEQRNRFSTEKGKAAAKESNRKWLRKEGNIDIKREWGRRWASNNPQWFDEWRNRNLDLVRKISRTAQLDGATNLTDTYVKKSIARGQFSITAVPNSLVELKRAYLQIYREIHKEVKP